MNHTINYTKSIRVARVYSLLLVLLDLHEDSHLPWLNCVWVFTSFIHSFLRLDQTSWGFKRSDWLYSCSNCCYSCSFDYFFLRLWLLVFLRNAITHHWPNWPSLASVPFCLDDDLFFLFYFYFWHLSLFKEVILSCERLLFDNLQFWLLSCLSFCFLLNDWRLRSLYLFNFLSL